MRNQVVASIATLTLLTACSDQDRGTRSFFLEAGSVIDSGHFGNATMHNTLVMTGAEQYADSLNRRFSSEIPTTINFAFNSSALDEQALAILRTQAAFIRAFPEVRFKVFGHTDLVGSNAYNRALGLRRAEAAVAFLVSQGISRSRLEAVVSFGETQPLIVTEGRERANRRTVTEVTGFVTNHPAILNGKYADVIFREYVTSAQPTSNVGTISSLASGNNG